MESKLKAHIAERIYAKWTEVGEWTRQHAKKNPVPFYSSIDVRNACYKIAAVDCNLFPAGFNNICEEDLSASTPILRKHIKNFHPDPKKLLIIPEANTRNAFYIENLETLLWIFERSGIESQVGWPGDEPTDLKSASGKTLSAQPIKRNQNTISAGDFVPDLLLINNDFSSGYPDYLDGIEQPTVPSHKLGWHTRKKSIHFGHYNTLAREFAELVDVEPCRFEVITEEVADVDFEKTEDLERIATTAEQVLKLMRERYPSLEDPAVFVKSNQGTYGMGITVIKRPDEVLQMNRRTKNKMSTGKNKLPVHSVIVQEAIPTDERFEELPAEPVIYLMGCDLVGGFLRANTEKGDTDNLNSKGMVFKKLCVSDLQKQMESGIDPTRPEHDRVMELIYGSIARLSILAAGKEISDIV